MENSLKFLALELECLDKKLALLSTGQLQQVLAAIKPGDNPGGDPNASTLQMLSIKPGGNPGGDPNQPSAAFSIKPGGNPGGDPNEGGD